VVVRELTNRLTEVVERTRESMNPLGERGAPSQLLVIEVVCALEKQLWMVRARLS
jgi:DNA-binding ferritin-like protein